MTHIAIELRSPFIHPTIITNVISLRNEISVLCAFYRVDIVFQYNSLQDIPAQIIEDLMALNISGAIATKNSKYRGHMTQVTAGTQLLLNFLELVRKIMHHFGPHRVMETIVDFDHLGSLKPDVKGATSTNAYPEHTPAQSSATKRPKSTAPFNPFASDKPSDRKHGRLELELNGETAPEVALSDKRMRMRRRIRFGFPNV
ncbi:hypothetical protein FRC08_000104 [Ceratobasidium sp. 394]|nr:hypothetical protein FRC08_000104 [Ceratobasidium sp. 394]KAG9087774.1 hypothetical protein FS749_002654 [Ceratobasidium sp. UAMH 11750]